MKTQASRNVERRLDDDTLIVSKTDPHGRITYGNREFTTFSVYSESEYLGKPHSIIRHPDMPRGVYKLMWTSLQQGKEIFAYVKNLAKDGSYYWVIANVTPSVDHQGQLLGYFSVRRKANPTGIKTITSLYQQMLQIERTAPSIKDGIEQSVAWLEEKIDSVGLSYEGFILQLQSGHAA